MVPVDGELRTPTMPEIALVELEKLDADQPVVETIDLIIAAERGIAWRLRIELDAGRGKLPLGQLKPLSDVAIERVCPRLGFGDKPRIRIGFVDPKPCQTPRDIALLHG